MTESIWLEVYPEIETIIKKALLQNGKNEDELPEIMSEIKNILFNF